MLINNKYHITYCSNIFKSKSWTGLLNKLKYYINFINKNKNKKIGLSLCISNAMLYSITKNTQNLKNFLKNQNAYINSINGFVYNTFHKKNIKDKIYYPDWTSNKRLNYTLKLINTLNNLTTYKKTIGISTSPIGYSNWTKTKYKNYILYKATINIHKIINTLTKIKQKTIHLDIEPEPDCFLYNFDSFLHFYNNWLIPLTKQKYKNKKNISEKKIITLIKKHIRLCYDICHFSVNFENHNNIIKKIKKHKIKVGRIQISSALEINNKYDVINYLNPIINSSFLHQTVKKLNHKFIKYTDIIHAIPKFNTSSVFRIHCHAPLFKKNINNIQTTQEETKKTLIELLKNKLTKNLEIETYTQQIISKEKQLIFIKNEYNWVINIINNLKIK